MSRISKVQRAKLPFVFVNMAITADGKIATANHAVWSFGSERDHEHLLELRATADAVMSGARTVNGGEISLGPGPARFRRLRLKNGLAEYNLRVLVSGSGSLDPDAAIFKHRFSPIIILVSERISPARLSRLQAVADAVKVCGRQEVDFLRALRWLRKRWGVKRLLCEGGGGVNDALFRADVVDELHLTICPKIFGGRNAPTLADGRGFDRLTKAIQMQTHSFEPVGDEIFAVFRRTRKRR